VETLTPQLLPFFWGAIALTGVAVIVLTVGLTLLLGTTSHRNIALPLVWIAGAVLAAAATAAALLLLHR
jgi:type IV secretory pathway VirB2 component (pilin)